MDTLPKALSTLIACAALTLSAPTVIAQTSTPKTYRIIAPAAPGGILDLTSRILAKALSETIGQPVIVENVPGAGGTLGIQAMLRAQPDGHTMVMGSLGPNSANYALQPNLPYEAKSLQPIIYVLSMPNVLVASPELGAQTLADVKRIAMSRPQGLNMAVSTNGSSGHLAGELIKSRAEIKATNVVYKGAAPAIVDLISGQVDLMVDNMITALPQIRNGKLIPIAVTTRNRAPELPDVPTLIEAGVTDIDVSVWLGLFVSAKVSPAVVQELNTTFQKILATPEIKQSFAQRGGVAVGGSTEEFSNFVAQETIRWSGVIRDNNLKAN